MEIKQFQIDEQSLDQMMRVGMSINHQSTQHSLMVIQAQELLTSIKGLYQARQQLINKCAAAQGINPNLIQSVDVDEKGLATVQLRDSVPTDPKVDSAKPE
jgi:hypothetical protein